MKPFTKLTALAAAALLVAVLIYTGCKKASIEETDYAQLVAAQDYSNSDLIHLIKHADPPLSDKELLGVLIAAGRLDDNIIKELLKRGQPPCSCPLSDETLQLILLFNAPHSEHIQKEMEKAGIAFDQNLLDNINLNDLPDMDIQDANLLLEKLLNLKFVGDGQDPFQSIVSVRDTVQVFGTLESGTYFVLAQEFIDAIDNLDLTCNGAPGSVNVPCLSKHIRVVDLEIIDSLTPAGDRMIDLVLVLPIAIDNPPVICDFGPTDSWNFCCGDLGAGDRCLFPGEPFKDATTELEAKLHNCPGPVWAINIGAFNSFETITDIDPGEAFTGNLQDPVPGDCLYDFHLFSTKTGCGFDDCLDASPSLPPAYNNVLFPKHEMAFYRQGAQLVADAYKQQPNWVPIAYDIKYNIGFVEHSHILQVTYGIIP